MKPQERDLSAFSEDSRTKVSRSNEQRVLKMFCSRFKGIILMSNAVYYELLAKSHSMSSAAPNRQCVVQTKSQCFLDKAFLREWTLLPEGNQCVMVLNIIYVISCFSLKLSASCVLSLLPVCVFLVDCTLNMFHLCLVILPTYVFTVCLLMLLFFVVCDRKLNIFGTFEDVSSGKLWWAF